MHYIGIDWADTSHQVAILTTEGKCVSEFIIQQDCQGFQTLGEHLDRLAPIQINIERPDGLLIDWLCRQQVEIFVTPPRAAASHRPRGSKDDRSDARLLADMIRMKSVDCYPLQRHSPTVEILRQQLRALTQLQRQQLRNANQLRQIIKQYYPVMGHLFSRITTNIALAFLQAYPTPEAAQSLSRGNLEKFLREQRYNRMKRLETLYQTLQRPFPKASVVQGYASHALALVALMQTIAQQIAQLKRESRQTFLTHPEAAWWQTLPGAGDLTVLRLLAFIGDNRAVYPSVTTLQALAGTVPITRRSGKFKMVRFRWACDKSLRKTMMDFARNSITKSGWAHSYYADQLQIGHPVQRAIRALANRWVCIIWTIWQRRETYNEALHVANRSRKGQAATRNHIAAASLQINA